MTTATAESGQIAAEDDFQQVEDSQLDHLVAAEERQEPSTLQGEELESFCESERNDVERAAEVRKFREGCMAVEQAARDARAWFPAAVVALEEILAAKVQEQTPQAEHYELRKQVITRIDDIVRNGLLQYRGLHVAHYGSFTSGLFTPSGDLDIAIEGKLEAHPNTQRKGNADMDGLEGYDVSDLDKDEKAALLRALCGKLRQKQICDGRVERILHARVPIIKFIESRSGIPCDMAVGSGGARFKSTVLRHLSQIDPRFPALMRILKLWAKAFHMNDASNGTFNTFALTLMVIFHLQTRSPPILPPICELFDLPAESIAERPLHMGRMAKEELLEESERRAAAWRGEGNTETLLELLSSFFALYSNAIGVWADNRSKRAVRCCTWAGRWAYKQWPRNYIVPIEDPFDSTDNCARSIFAANVDYAKGAFEQGLGALLRLPGLEVLQGVVSTLFDPKDAPDIRHPFAPKGRNGDFRQGWREVGWGRPANGQTRSDSYGKQQHNDGSRNRPEEGNRNRRTSRRDADKPGSWRAPEKVPLQPSQPFPPPPPGFSTGIPTLNELQHQIQHQAQPAQPNWWPMQQPSQMPRLHEAESPFMVVPPPGFQQLQLQQAELAAGRSPHAFAPPQPSGQVATFAPQQPPGFPGIYGTTFWDPPQKLPQTQPKPQSSAALQTAASTSSKGSRDLSTQSIDGKLWEPSRGSKPQNALPHVPPQPPGFTYPISEASQRHPSSHSGHAEQPSRADHKPREPSGPFRQRPQRSSDLLQQQPPPGYGRGMHRAANGGAGSSEFGSGNQQTLPGNHLGRLLAEAAERHQQQQGASQPAPRFVGSLADMLPDSLDVEMPRH